jgi:hypothetical protein
MKFLHALQAQVLIDMVQRAAALMGEPTQSYAEEGAALARRGVFSPEDLRLYRAVVGFRNVLVHGYTSVDTLRISQILAGREYRKLADDWVQLGGLRIYGLDWRRTRGATLQLPTQTSSSSIRRTPFGRRGVGSTSRGTPTA